MSQINNQPNLIKPFFEKAGYSDKTINQLVKVYSHPHKNIFKYNSHGYANCNGIRKKVEDWSYVFVWIIPLLLILPLTVLKIKEKYARRKK